VASLLTALLCLLYSYHSLQPSVYPFIPELEWAYQAVFLGATLFVLAKAGLLLHAAGGALGEAAVRLLKKASGLGERPPGLDEEVKKP
jgi:NADPH:quinone reductase-like Zn-dependent oxidoreductase